MEEIEPISLKRRQRLRYSLRFMIADKFPGSVWEQRGYMLAATALAGGFAATAVLAITEPGPTYRDRLEVAQAEVAKCVLYKLDNDQTMDLNIHEAYPEYQVSTEISDILAACRNKFPMPQPPKGK